MLSKRDRAAALLDWLGVTELQSRRGLPILRLLTYHRVRDSSQGAVSDPELVSASREQFLSQMCYVKQHYAPISFHDLADVLDGRIRCPRDPIIVTFDDGYLDNYETAFPVLKQLDVKATFFIVTDYVGTTRSYWFERVASAIAVAPPGHYVIESQGGPPIEVAVPRDGDARRALVRGLLKTLKAAPAHEASEWVERLSGVLGAGQVTAGFDTRLFGWPEVVEMHRSGLIEFGSHSRSHAILSRVDGERLHHEVEDSKKAIEQATGDDCVALAYPVGGRGAYSPAVIQAAEAAGYRFACTNFAGVNRLGQLEPFELRRSPVERYLTAPRFRASLAFPGYF